MLGRIYSLILLTATAHIAVVHTTTTDTENIKMDSTGRLLCKLNVPDDHFHRVKWFKSRRDDVFEYGDRAVVSWDGTAQPPTTGRYGIDTDLSLKIYNTSIQDEGVYQCYITRGVDPFVMIHDVSLTVYALPSKVPLLQRVNDTSINCSVDRVYPLLYPHLGFNHGKYAVQNEDRTYNTSVSGPIQDIPSESKVVSCSFPHFNYSEVSSMHLNPATTSPSGNDGEPTTTDVTALESPGQGTKDTNRELMLVLSTACAAAAVFGVIGVALLLARRRSKRRSSEETRKKKNALLY